MSLAVEDLLGRELYHPTTWLNGSSTCAPPPRTALVTACLAPPRARCVWFPDRDRARSFAAQVMGPSRAPPHNIDALHRLRLKVEVLDLLRGSGEDKRRAPLRCAQAGIEPHDHA